MSELDPEQKTFPALAPLLWAVFLGVSWTWVIGMFMPVLLVRDYGAWGWVVFAAPNVIGAAAMGWVLRDAAASRAFVERHAAAGYAFSIVTIAFHVFFAMWMIRRIGGPEMGVGFSAGVLIVGLIAFALMRGPRTRWVAAGVALVLSLIIWNMMYGQGALAIPSVEPLRGGGAGADSGGSGLALAFIAPVFLLGFALNPYLDLTFHRARQFTSPVGGRVAFGVGFGVVFCSMILFTLLYARFLAPAVEGGPLSRVMSIYLLVHLCVQSAFTIGAHLSELPWQSRAHVPTLALTLLATLVLAGAIGSYASTPRTFRGRDLGEVIYWCFLGFYGLVFPGYVWLCAMPRKDRSPTAGPTRHALAVLAGVVVVGFPMFWMGFVEGRHVWLAPGLLMILLARPLVSHVHASAHVEEGR